MPATAMTDINAILFSRPVRIHGPDDARAALAAARALGMGVALCAPPGAGALWLRRVAERAASGYPDVPVAAVLDCGDRAGEAQGALAAGVRHLLFRGSPAAADRLADIAAASGAVVLRALPEPLDLRGARDPVAACTAWLAGGTGGGGMRTD
ncbi:hypothetical protein [Azospirillum halopraeferens]|uniref:hypothetical protein n=1 Tax=Azospirillum halopraeferens TaxID=34010 RepID=UPI00040D691A|nr:hypothetical protein [Azospirillum halopraeferens]